MSLGTSPSTSTWLPKVLYSLSNSQERGTFSATRAKMAQSKGLPLAYRRVTGLVRQVILDPNVQPHHAWRYMFKAIGIDGGIEEIVLDAICGHAALTQGRKYSRVTLKKKFEAIRKFPRYLP
jgi:hypothetical protein